MVDPPLPPATLPAPVQLFQEVFRELRPNVAMPLERLYVPDVLFEDPLHRARGLEALRRYFQRLNANLRLCRFEYGPAFLMAGQAPPTATEAVLVWNMNLELRRGPRHPIVVPGVTRLRFAEKVTYQRDYFDAGALVYEHVPIVGALVRLVKGGLGRAAHRDAGGSSRFGRSRRGCR
jgi:hypothetical protein